MRRLWPVFVLLILAACSANAPQQPLPTHFILPTSTPVPAVSAGNARQPKPLVFWEAAGGQLQAEAVDVWSFAGSAGDQVVVRARGYGFEPLLTLIASDGSLLDSGPTVSATLPESAVYLVHVITSSGQQGRYEIGLSYRDHPHPEQVQQPLDLPVIVGVPTPLPAADLRGTYIGSLTPEVTTGKTIDAEEADHLYTFDGSAGTYIRLEMNRVSGEITPRLTLYAADGRPIATDGGSGDQGALLRNIYIERDGLYTVRASGHGSGGYSIRLLQASQPSPVTPTILPVETATPLPTLTGSTPSPLPPGNRLEAGIPFEDTVPEAGLTAVYTLTLRAGQIITAGAVPHHVDDNSDETMPVLAVEMFDPIGEATAGILTHDGSAVLPLYEVPANGSYRLNVTVLEGSGRYLVGYDEGPFWMETLRGPAPRDERLEMTLDRPGTRDVWTIELRAGDIITAAANPAVDSPLNPALMITTLENPGEPIALDINSGGQRSPYIRSLTIPASGLYLISVYDRDAAAVGGYALIWRYINMAPTATPPPAFAPLLTLADTVPEHEYRFYTFQGRAGQIVEVRAEAADGSSLDPVAALIDPDGRLLIEVDDTEHNLNPSFRLELPVSGSYSVRINGYLSGGAFTLYVRELF